MGYDCGPYACGPGFIRRYVTKDERIARLNEYQTALETEIQAVKERIEHIEKA